MRLSGDKNVETPQCRQTAVAIRDGGGDPLPPLLYRWRPAEMWGPTSVMFTPVLSLVQAPAATLISHNYLGCAGVGNANPGGGATPPLPPKLSGGSIFGGKSMRLLVPHPLIIDQ